jgi:HK97 family phage major capsid protein
MTTWQLSPKERRDFSGYSICNLIRQMTEGEPVGGLEVEVSRELAHRIGSNPGGVYVPVSILNRDLTVGASTAGGHTVATVLDPNIIGMLRNRSVAAALGATSLTGLVGNVSIPRQTSGSTAYWLAESGAPTESAQAFDQVALTPKTVGAFTDISRRLVKQSSVSIEQFVRDDLAANLATAIDLAALNGSGASNQPTGILNTSGITSTTAALSWAALVAMETAAANAESEEGARGYVVHPATLGTLKTTLKAAGIAGYLADTALAPDSLIKATIGGVPLYVSSQVPTGTVIYGSDWRNLILASWGVLDLRVDLATHSTSGAVRIVALQDVDVAVRHAASFSVLNIT